MCLRACLLFAALVLGTAGAYTVRPGDTLYSIARANATTVAALLELNGLSSTDIKVGQELRLPPPGSVSVGPAPVATPPAQTGQIAGVQVTAPAALKMGSAFVLRLSGERAGDVTVRFPSEVGEDVRQPAEALRPLGAAGEYVVLGRVVLGKTTPVTYEVKVGEEVLTGRIPVSGLDQSVQHLNLPRSVSRVLEDPARKAEDAAVEAAYARRTPQFWTRPFAPALSTGRATSSSFGQPRTYVAGGAVAYHYGVDYPAKTGTSVLAVNDGTVVLAGRYPVRGGLVVIDHGAGVTSLYFHQSKVTVKPGMVVSRGQKVGEVGNTGLSSAPHLHLEIRVRGEGTHPEAWMNRLWPR